MKFTVVTPKPRNPLVAAMRFRRAGAHQSGSGSQRQQAQRELQRQMQEMKSSP